jgi:riboflavin-specific deaminase-like protein
MGNKFPFLYVNMAMTADGKIATANRKISSFGSDRDKAHLLELRSTADAVMAGARTVDLNPVNLGPGALKYRTARKKRGLSEYNIRVVVSGSGTIDPDAEIFRRRFSPIIVLTTSRIQPKQLKRLRTLADDVQIFGSKRLDFKKAFAWLRKKWGIKRLLCEGGGELNQALLQAGLVDEMHVTLCPLIFGGAKAPTISDGDSPVTLASAFPLQLKSARRYGEELFLVYRVRKPRS